MIDIGLAAWLVLGAALFAGGVLMAVVRHDRGGALGGLLLMLAATSVAMSALVRFRVLPATALATLLIAVLLGGLLILVLATMAGDGEES